MTPESEGPSLAHSGRGPGLQPGLGVPRSGHAAHKPGSSPHFPQAPGGFRTAPIPGGSAPGGPLVTHFLSVRKTCVSKELQIICQVQCVGHVPRFKGVPRKVQGEKWGGALRAGAGTCRSALNPRPALLTRARCAFVRTQGRPPFHAHAAAPCHAAHARGSVRQDPRFANSCSRRRSPP